jgi:predicted acylesterase/phospholipase RssA
MTALVLSAGGMYGAYQAGAWKVLAEIFQPDLIVGASIGAVNGWGIAGGCEPDELIRLWLNLEEAARYRWKVPSGVFGGVLDSRPLQRAIRHVYESYQPRIEFGMVVTDLVRLRPRIVPGSEVTWQHLVATTAIVGIFDQVRLGGKLTSDGGLLSAVPLWAAAELGARKAVVIDVLPEPPGIVAKTFVGAMRMLSPFRAIVPPAMEVIRIAPRALLGRPLESLYWSHRNAAKWILQGQADAAAMEHSIVNCFERE